MVIGGNNKLGKGLGALLGEQNNNNDVVGVKKEEILISNIVPNPYQPRKTFDEQELSELAESIKQNGLLQPIVVRKKDNKYEIIAGERRFRACQNLGFKEIPVIIKDFDDKQALTLAIVENIQRSDLNPIDEAESYNKLINEFNYKQEEVADVVGKNRATIANMLRLLKLPDEVKEMLKAEQIEMGHAKVLVSCPDAIEIAKKVIDENLSVRATERLVANNKNIQIVKQKEPKTKAENLKKYELELVEKINLKTKVEFNSAKNIGKIVIEYNNLDELENFIKNIKK
ncbi:MAG: ParB/RepB/Spo0J family partition protein [Rickettsiales bacterium]|nr:MAG: ParB/RepB/Spo0J family partition protein [Rickettsiales bacterium]